MLNVVSSEKERMETLFNEENLDCHQKIIKPILFDLHQFPKISK